MHIFKSFFIHRFKLFSTNYMKIHIESSCIHLPFISCKFIFYFLRGGFFILFFMFEFDRMISISDFMLISHKRSQMYFHTKIFVKNNFHIKVGF
jgi:hypothetical protein